MKKKTSNRIIDSQDTSTSLIPRKSKRLADHKGEWIHRDTARERVETEESEPAIHHREEIFRGFARQIAKIKRLSDEEEYTLGMLVQEHNDINARKKLVLHNMRLALKMAHQYRRDWTNLMDLVQEASAGMAIAAKKWDPRVGTRFGTYAAFWIKAQLTKFIMNNARLIHTGTTRAGRKVYFSLPQIRKKLLLEGKTPTVAHIAKEVGEDEQEVSLILSRLQGRETSLSTPLEDDGSLTLQDTLYSSNQDPESIVAKSEIQRVIKEVIVSFEKTLKEERDLAIWRENLIANEPVNLMDLGKRYQVSKQRIGQLAIRLKRAFRRHIIEELGPTTQLSWLFRNDD